MSEEKERRFPLELDLHEAQMYWIQSIMREAQVDLSDVLPRIFDVGIAALMAVYKIKAVFPREGFSMTIDSEKGHHDELA